MIRFKYPLLLTFSVLLSITGNAYAFTFDKSSHSLQFGGASNTGNSENTNITVTLADELEYKTWTYNSSLDGQLATSKGQESARTLRNNGELNNKLSARSFSFIKASVLYDKYGTYDFVTRSSLGLGRIIFVNNYHKLTAQVGPGFIHRRIAGEEEFQNRPFINFSNKYTWTISKQAEFRQSFVTETDRVTTHIDFTTAINTKIITNIALEISFNMRYDTKIPALSKNQKKLDTASKATIVYSF